MSVCRIPHPPALRRGRDAAARSGLENKLACDLEGRMKSHARVVIVGGGMMGVGLLYHLALEGWTDVALVEKGELTSGSTWHAAGQCPHFNSSLNITKVH